MNPAKSKLGEFDASRNDNSSQARVAHGAYFKNIADSQLRYLQSGRRAYQQYLDALQDVISQMEERLVSAHRALVAVAQETQANCTMAFQQYTQVPQYADNVAREEAHRSYMDVIQNAQKRNAEATRAFLSSLDEIASTRFQLSSAAQQAFGEALTAVGEEIAAEQVEAVRNYIQALKDAWAILEVDKTAQALFANQRSIWPS